MDAGSLIRSARERSGLSRRELARRALREAAEVGHFEQGRQGDSNRVGQRLHDFEGWVSLAVGNVRQERHAHVGALREALLAHALLLQAAQQVGKKDLVVHGGVRRSSFLAAEITRVFVSRRLAFLAII